MDLLDLIAQPNVATLAMEENVKISVTVMKLSVIHRLDVKVSFNIFNGSQKVYAINQILLKTKILYSVGSSTLSPKLTSNIIKKTSVTRMMTVKTSKYYNFEWFWNNFK